MERDNCKLPIIKKIERFKSYNVRFQPTDGGSCDNESKTGSDHCLYPCFRCLFTLNHYLSFLINILRNKIKVFNNLTY